MNEIKEVKSAIYAGMSIYKEMEDFDIKLEDDEFFIEDRKYLSLYLGLLNTNNRISDSIQNDSIKIPISKLNLDEYLEIYKNNFVDILCEINFESITQFFNYLLSKDIVKIFNKEYNINILKVEDIGNKQLVKK